MDALDLLTGRQSPLRVTEPAPQRHELRLMFLAASRAPDHGRLRPWRFIVVRGEAIAQLGSVFADALRRRDTAASTEQLERERRKAARAPLVVIVAAKLRTNHKIPVLEQWLAVGAATQNLILAAHAQGYGAMWRTGSNAYDDGVKHALGLAMSDQLAGFIYIGTPALTPGPIAVADDDEIVSEWKGVL